jgi:hypothetical protein
MYPHERSLVKKHAARTFTILGVNSDRDRGELKQVLEKERITWRSFWDGGSDGPIARRWNVKSWPTTYVLDHRGVIRGKGLRGVALERLVDVLVEDAGAGR